MPDSILLTEQSSLPSSSTEPSLDEQQSSHSMSSSPSGELSLESLFQDTLKLGHVDSTSIDDSTEGNGETHDTSSAATSEKETSIELQFVSQQEQGGRDAYRFVVHSSGKNASTDTATCNAAVEEVTEKLGKCVLDRNSTCESSCGCVREVETLLGPVDSLKAERERERGYLISVCMERDSLKRKIDLLKTQLRAARTKNRKQAKKLKDLDGKIAGLASLEREGVAQREQIAELTHQVMYLEVFYNEKRAEAIQAQEELVSVRNKLLQQGDREMATKERFATMENNLQASMTEGFLSRRETEGLKKRVKILEKLIRRSIVGKNDTDDAGDTSDTNIAIGDSFVCSGRKLKRVNTM